MAAQNNIYYNMRNGLATNELAKVRGRKKDFELDEITGDGKMTQDEFTIAIKNLSERQGLRTSTRKLLDALLIEFTETNARDTKITLSLKKYMELRNIDNETAARRQVNEDLETLYDLSISFRQTGKGGKNLRSYRDMRLVIDKGIKNGIISCTFHPEFYELLKSYNVMPMSKIALGLDDRYYSSAYYLLRKFAEHMNMNYFKKNKNLISVIKLLEATPKIPTYEEVEKNDRGHYKERIIEPFERDLDRLNELQAITWEYCHSNVAPLSDAEISTMDWETFSKLLIHFELSDYPARALPEQGKSRKKTTEQKFTKNAQQAAL